MKYRFLDTIKDMTALCANLAVMITFLYLCLGTTKMTPDGLKTFVICAFCLILYVQRKFVDKLPLFLLGHILATFLAFLACKGTTKESVIYFIFLFMLAILSFAQRVGSEEPGRSIINPFFSVGLMLVTYFILDYLHEEEILMLLPKYEIAYGMFFLVDFYMQNFVWNDVMNRKFMENVPTARLFKTGAPYVCGVGLFYGLVCVFGINIEKVRTFAAIIRSLIKKFMIWFFSHFKPITETYEGEAAESIIEPEVFMMGDEVVKETSRIWILLQRILEYVVAIIVITGAIILIVYFVITIIKRFHGTDKRKTLVETDYVEEKERIEKKQTFENDGFKIPFFMKPSEKIRRLYVNLALRNKEIIKNPEYVTPREMAECFDASKMEAALGFMLVYEKARYTPREVTSKDYKEAKSYADCLKD